MALPGESGAGGTPGLILFPLSIVLTGLAAQEFVQLAQARGIQVLRSVVICGSMAIVAATGISAFVTEDALPQFAWPMLATLLCVNAAFLFEMRRFDGKAAVMPQLGADVLGLLYVGGLMASVALMRWLGPNGVWGIPALASLVIVVKLADIGAYTVGRLFGKHKMTPVLSPGKTWEGAAGAMIFGCLGSWLAIELLLPAACPKETMPKFFPLAWLVYGVVITPLGMTGDLAESLLKRDAGKKDSSDWMPGFGGVLDILDSILFAAPAALLFWHLFA